MLADGRPGAARPRGQSGQSLVEVIVAMVLIGGVFVAFAAALKTVSTGTVANERAQKISAGLMAYGEILQSQVPYQNCVGGISDSYYFFADNNFVTLSNTPGPNRWRRPNNVYPEIVSVQSFDPSSQTWASGCITPDPGLQRVTYRIVACDGNTTSPCHQPISRTGQIVKRRTGPS